MLNDKIIVSIFDSNLIKATDFRWKGILRQFNKDIVLFRVALIREKATAFIVKCLEDLGCQFEVFKINPKLGREKKYKDMTRRCLLNCDLVLYTTGWPGYVSVVDMADSFGIKKVNLIYYVEQRK